MNKYIIPPGETIKELIFERNIKKKDVAQYLGMTGVELNRLLRGATAINENIAVKLEEIFEISKTFWLNLQKNYEEDLEKPQIVTGEYELLDKKTLKVVNDLCQAINIGYPNEVEIKNTKKGLCYLAKNSNDFYLMYFPEDDAFLVYFLDGDANHISKWLITPVILKNSLTAIRFAKNVRNNICNILMNNRIQDVEYIERYFGFVPEDEFDEDTDFIYGDWKN